MGQTGRGARVTAEVKAGELLLVERACMEGSRDSVLYSNFEVAQRAWGKLSVLQRHRLRALRPYQIGSLLLCRSKGMRRSKIGAAICLALRMRVAQSCHG